MIGYALHQHYTCEDGTIERDWTGDSFNTRAEAVAFLRRKRAENYWRFRPDQGRFTIDRVES